MDEAIFAERRFEFMGGELVVRFFAPTKAPGGEFQCHYFIGWPERPFRRYACGEDGVQALMLAMRSVHVRLLVSDAYKAGQLTLWGGQTELDLPPAFSSMPP